MNSQKNFVARVQITLRELDEGAENCDVYEKMLELFHIKQKTGSLRNWLVELAYQEAARELLPSQQQREEFKSTVVPSRQSVQKAPNPPAKQQAPMSEQRLEEVSVKPQAKVAGRSVAENTKPSAGRTVSERQELITLGGAAGDDEEIFDDEDADFNMEQFLPITLAQRAEEEKKKQREGKGSSLPRGISSLVMPT